MSAVVLLDRWQQQLILLARGGQDGGSVLANATHASWCMLVVLLEEAHTVFGANAC